MALTVPHIEELLIPGAETLGYELLAVEVTGGDVSILRVYIDMALRLMIVQVPVDNSVRFWTLKTLFQIGIRLKCRHLEWIARWQSHIILKKWWVAM